MLTVTNRNDFDFIGRYDGQDYPFPSGKTTAVPEDAAKHIFGVGLADKQDILVRHGWMQSSGQLAEAMSKLNKFSFNVADQLEPGEIIDTQVASTPPAEEQEQGSAPLQTGSGGEVLVPDGAKTDPSQPTIIDGGSILDVLNAAGGVFLNQKSS